MKIVTPSVKLIDPPSYEELIRKIEQAGRVCYKSESKIKDGSAEAFVQGIVKRGHEAVLEHSSVTVKFICDRGVSHEIVRHRMASYCQESTRYCNYSNDKFGSEVTYIDLGPGIDLDKKDYTGDQISRLLDEWGAACEDAEMHYMNMLEIGASPQIARAVLNNSTKTEIIITMNLREWRHFLNLRAAPTAHPQMREIAGIILEAFRAEIPELVSDIHHIV